MSASTSNDTSGAITPSVFRTRPSLSSVRDWPWLCTCWRASRRYTATRSCIASTSLACQDTLVHEQISVHRPDGRVFLYGLGCQRLGVTRLVTLVMAVSPVSDEIDDDVVVIFRPVRHGESHSRETRLRVVSVDMDDREAESLGEVAGVPCRPAVDRQRRESNLIVEDDVDCAARRVPVQPAEIEGLCHNALPGEGCISVDENGNHRRRIALRVLVVSGVLERPGHALYDRIHELEVAGIGSEGDVNRGPVRETQLALGALVILYVPGPLDREGPFGLDPLEFAGDLLVSERHNVGQDVETAAVGHPQHNPFGADIGRLLEREIQHGNHDVGPLDGEALLAEVCLMEKTAPSSRPR